jgi:monoamine oxidase
MVFEDTDGSVRRDLDFAPMAGALRLAGGLSGLIDGLGSMLGAERVRGGHQVTDIRQAPSGVCVVSNHAGKPCEIHAERVVVALPPRLAARTIRFAPVLEARVGEAMVGVATWMAGHAKVVAVYSEPFWRQDGLSGDAMSRSGPLVEIHDASPSAGEGALFGFVGVPATERPDPTALATLATIQLAKLFGPRAAEPIDVLVRDWAAEPQTATDEDRAGLSQHPSYGMPAVLSDLWDGRLVLASTELASTNGGLLEGALEAASAAARTLSV